jgi:hypothetical protein
MNLASIHQARWRARRRAGHRVHRTELHDEKDGAKLAALGYLDPADLGDSDAITRATQALINDVLDGAVLLFRSRSTQVETSTG